jgi:hypothetical protein
LAKVKLQKYEPIGPGYSAGLRELVTRMLQLNVSFALSLREMMRCQRTYRGGIIQPKSRPTTKELLASTEMKYWKKEYERRKQKAEHDKVAVELEKKSVILVPFGESSVSC